MRWWTPRGWLWVEDGAAVVGPHQNFRTIRSNDTPGTLSSFPGPPAGCLISAAVPAPSLSSAFPPSLTLSSSPPPSPSHPHLSFSASQLLTKDQGMSSDYCLGTASLSCFVFFLVFFPKTFSGVVKIGAAVAPFFVVMLNIGVNRKTLLCI